MESLNSVTAYGPQAELDRFKALCIVDGEGDRPTIDFRRVLSGPEDARVASFRSCIQENIGVYEFAFDTRWHFPFDVFHELARQFPSIAFDCDAIHAGDEWCGFGWFNPPPGGENFADCHEVPEGYWTHGVKRDPLAQLRYLNLVARLKNGR